MIYHGDSYKIQYGNCDFHSALELSWFLFIEQTISNAVYSQPLAYKNDLPWYPDLKFSVLIPSYIQIFAEVKPLSEPEFNSKLNLRKYRYQNEIVCILGSTYTEYLFLNESEALTSLFKEKFTSEIWEQCSNKAINFARLYGTKKALPERNYVVQVGKYKGLSLREIELKDPNYHQWFLDNVLG